MMLYGTASEGMSFLYGTAWKEDATESLVFGALETGFRAIDTANQRKHYFEEAVGRGIARSGVPREQLFLQTKFTHRDGQDDRLPFDPRAAIADQVAIPNWYAAVGITSLAIIAIGLIVTWAGYIKGVRWTWFVMFVIVWVWAFPVLLLPYLQLWRNVVAITEWLPDAIKQSGPSRDFVEVVLIFVLMVLALVLPVKTLFLGAKGWLPSDRTKLTTDD